MKIVFFVEKNILLKIGNYTLIG